MNIKVDTWKVFTLVLGILIMPLAGWVWQTNLNVAEVRNDLGDLEVKVSKVEKDIEEYEENVRTLIGVEKDIEHIRSTLSRIEELVTH
jgi:cell division protein FtsL